MKKSKFQKKKLNQWNFKVMLRFLNTVTRNLIATIVDNFKSNKQPEVDEALPFLPLLPQPRKESNLVYTRQLEKALKNPDIVNIALTGSYGSGKSSIILGIKEFDEKRVLQISFSSLGANIQGLINEGESESHSKLVDVANLIQKEVLKQILFREKKSKLPDSNFLRISNPKLIYQFTASLVVSSLIFLTLLSLGVSSKVADSITFLDEGTYIVLLCDAYIVTVSTIWLFLQTSARTIRIDKIGAASLSFTLNKSESNSYFDEYLAEMLYFFESTKYDVVVFEDIDRFQNLYIFENLRQLNTILNNASQVKQKIRFVYAVKDSIFTKSVLDKTNELIKSNDNSNTETSNDQTKKITENIDFKLNDENIYNRTKFFDYIIPVIPFITSSSSNDHMLSFFDESLRDELKIPVQTASKYISDMRLVKNLHNEYLVFKEMIFSPNSGLKEEKLFAMVIYKNINLEDFELIKEGKSKLNLLMKTFVKIIGTKIANNNVEIASLKKRSTNLTSLQDRASMFGELLQADMNRHVTMHDGSNLAITLDGAGFSEADLMKQSFWDQYIQDEIPDLKITFTSGNTGYSETATYSKIIVQKVVGDELNKDKWEESDRKDLTARMLRHQELANQLKNIPLKSAIEKYPVDLGKELKKILVDDELTWDLIQAGLIDNDFTNYTSIYNDMNVSHAARAFILLNLNHDTPSPNYKFKNNTDIKNMLEQVGEQGLRSQGIFNIQIFDYLLNLPMLDKSVFIVLAGFNSDQQSHLEFIDLYLNEGKHPDKLIRKLTPRWLGTLEFIAESKTLLDMDKAQFLDVAITEMDSQESYITSDYLLNLLNRRPEYFRSLSKIKNIDRVSNFISKLAKIGVEFHDLNSLSSTAKPLAIDKHVYKLNLINMELLTRVELPSLSVLYTDFDNVYSKVSKHLDQYSALFTDHLANNYSITSEESITPILNDISKFDSTTVSKLINRIDNKHCSVHEIEKVPSSTWTPLFENTIPEFTVSNILAYYKSTAGEENTLSPVLAKFICAKPDVIMIDKPYEDYDELLLESISVAILDTDSIPVSDKIILVKKFYPKYYIKISKLKLNDHSLVGKLLNANVINDKVENYNYLKSHFPESIESWILSSAKLIEYIQSVDFTSTELDVISLNNNVIDGLKKYVIDNIVTLTSIMTDDAKRHLAKYIAHKNLPLGFDSLKELVAFSDSSDVATIIVNSQSLLTNANMTTILNLSSSEYKYLTQSSKPAKLPLSQIHLTLLEDLKNRGYVSSYSEKNKKLVAYMKKSPPS